MRVGACAGVLVVPRSGVVGAGGEFSARARRAALALGVCLEGGAVSPGSGSRGTIEVELDPARATAIVGPSGAGKSTLLRDIALAARGRGVPVELVESSSALGSGSAIDLVGGSVEGAMRVLAAVGLADAGVFVRRAGELSEGQRARLRLALALAALARGRGGQGAGARLLLVDELCASLDDGSARALAVTLTRAVRRAGVTLVAATHRTGLLNALCVGRTIRLSSTGEAEVASRETRGLRAFPLTISLGGRGDYEALAPLHYRSTSPATMERVLTAREARSGRLLGVLTVSRPTLNSAARELAWPGRYTGCGKRAAARRLNDELRCISRVIVTPSHRGLGVARRLVRSYLRDPLTPASEAYAAMGAASPFFERGGMTAFAMPASARDARLLDFLHHVGLRRVDLTTPTLALRRVLRTTPAASVEHELKQWAVGMRAVRDESMGDRFARACALVASSPTAYFHAAG